MSACDTMVNIAIGVIVGVAVMGFLIMPAVSASRQSKLNKQTVKFSDQIANSEITDQCTEKRAG